MKKIEHIGIAVSNLEVANQTYSKILKKQPYKNEIVETEGVRTSFLQCENLKIELLEGLNDNNPISNFIKKRGEGIHHIAFAVDDIFSEIKRLKKLGFKIIDEMPKKGADNKLIAFIHPKGTNHVLIELCQEIK